MAVLSGAWLKRIQNSFVARHETSANADVDLVSVGTGAVHVRGGSGGLKVDTGGLTITAGGLSLAAGNATVSAGQTVTLAAGVNFALDTTTGTKIGTATTQKLGFYNATPIVQPTKAAHGNWATIANVTAALAELGLVDLA